jgi:hypothetical protein
MATAWNNQPKRGLLGGSRNYDVSGLLYDVSGVLYGGANPPTTWTFINKAS